MYKEAEVALKSVFDESDFKEFLEYNEVDRQEKLSELTELVTGVRLFNKDCNKGGVGIEERKLLTRFR